MPAFRLSLIAFNLFIIIVFFPCFLYADVTQLERIVITPNRNPRRLIIDEGIINQIKPIAVSDLLNYSASSDLEKRGSQGVQQDISFRGSTFQQVLVMIDGLRINDPQTAHFNLDLPLSIEDIEYVDLDPGYGRASFGPDSIAGAINFKIKRPFENKIISEISGGNHDSIKGLFSLSKAYENLSNRLTLESSESDGFQPYTDSKIFNISNFTYWKLNDVSFDLGLGYNEKEFGAYDFYTPFRGFPSKEWTKTKFLSLKTEIPGETITLKPNFLWRRHNDKFMLDVNRPDLYLNHHRNDVYSFGLDTGLLSSKLGDINFGIQNTQEKLNSVGLGKHSRWQHGIYIDDRKEIFDNMDINIGLRFDKFQEFKDEFSGTAGLEYKFPNFDLFCSLSRSVRIPSYTELYYSDSTTQGNSNLSSEKAINYEVGILRELDKFSARSCVFLRDEEDGIDWLKSSSDVKWQSRNIDSHTFGIENSFKAKINDRLDTSFNYTYTDKPKVEGFDYKYGPSNIAHLISTIFNMKFGEISQNLNFIYKKKPKRNGWLLFNTNSSYELKNNYEIFLQTENILNVEYEEIPGIPSPGRLVRLGVRAEW